MCDLLAIRWRFKQNEEKKENEGKYRMRIVGADVLDDDDDGDNDNKKNDDDPTNCNGKYKLQWAGYQAHCSFPWN